MRYRIDFGASVTSSPHDLLVAQAGACFERVTDVVVDRVARVEHPCEASLGPLGRAGGEDVLGDHQHAADRASRERSRQPRCPGAEHDHVDIAFPGRGRRRQAPRQVHVTRPLPTVCRWRSSARPRGGPGRRSRGRRTPRRCPHAASASSFAGVIIFMYLHTAARLTGTKSVVEFTLWSWWIMPVSVATSTLAAVVARAASTIPPVESTLCARPGPRPRSRGRARSWRSRTRGG